MIERFWGYVDKSAGPDKCWPWTGGKSTKGYGYFWLDEQRGKVPAHRVAYELAFERPDEALQVDHSCRNRSCCNPTHLRLVTNKQNQENRIAQRNSTTGIRGVERHRNKFHARVTHNGQRIYLGTFNNPSDAAQAAKAKRLELFTHNNNDLRRETT